MRVSGSFVVCANLALYCPADATVTEYTSKSAWESAAGAFTTLDFTDLPENTLITDQYANQGILFTDGLDFIYYNTNIFLNDGVGVNGAFDEIALAFAMPMTSISADHPGFLQIKLYAAGELIYESGLFSGGGTGHFSGLISTIPFDAAIVLDPTGGVVIDDLHFGPPVPAPGVLALFVLAALGAPWRHREQ